MLARALRRVAQIVRFTVRLLTVPLFADMEGGATSRKEIARKVQEGRYRLFCLLLYTEFDTSFISFVKKNHKNIATLSGKETFVFWLQDIEDAAPLFFPQLEVTRAVDVTEDTRELAMLLGIPFSKLPCMAFFRTLRSRQAVIYSFSDSWTQSQMAEHVKAVFDVTTRVLAEGKATNDRNTLRGIRAGLSLIKAKAWIGKVASPQTLGSILKLLVSGTSP